MRRKTIRRFHVGAFRNNIDDIFGALVAFLVCVCVWATSVLMLVSHYPNYFFTYFLYIISALLGAAIYFYLKKSRGCLMMNALGIVYLPVNGCQTYVRWKQISKIDAASGLMRAYDITGKRVFVYTYGLRKHDALWALVRRYTKNYQRLATALPTTRTRSHRITTS